ncbi:N-acetylglutaminylglutamine amidotransferase [Magnetofaba australis]|uniref:asparagine synthase (glutamine-hydrolyzing) n=1 Tax=Magnetofaba australis IT-1 TaxID=1434232 RepID=A0A1Y2K2M7_9PROT|nr:N-acetylglutaminylglutamine amidotransferase [Magnetofaba australis]OSM02263.1 putative asparagine synthase amidotransferase [Magnetofaba australis IT-1]
MCGLCGIVDFSGAAPDLAPIEAMKARLAPRGPDAEGSYQKNHVALGHRRLRVIDLTDAGAQPMVDDALGMSLVFNGCIYNHKELRAELEEHGYSFRSHSDTEVILKSYHRWGLACVERFNGMFAFAIHEHASGRVILGRDRLGIKPLYVARQGSQLRFASTLPALLAAGGVDTELDPEALHHYMTFHSVVPAPLTLFKGVRKLPPATLWVIDRDGSQSDTTYWRLSFPEDPADAGRSFAEWQEMTLDVLRRAVKRRLVADVPVGLLLSGGLDSSLMAGLLREAGQQDLATFSIGFEDAGGESGNEFEYSDIVAQRFDTRHHKITVDGHNLLKWLGPTIAAQSEPMVSHDNIGFYLLSREVAKQIKVVQSGQGADEVFGGYHWYPPMLGSQNPVADYSRAFFDRDHDEYSRIMHPRLVGDDYSTQFVTARFAQDPKADPANRALKIDATVMLTDDPVKRVDNMTMAWGLEARVPFLDHEVVELAARIPPRFKIDNGGKYVLKEAARRVIPHEVIDRPKGYFPVPMLKYLQGETLERVRGVLTDQTARQRELFDPAYVETLLAAPHDHITPLRGSKLWQLALLEFWLREQEAA